LGEERMSCDTLKKVFFNLCHTFLITWLIFILTILIYNCHFHVICTIYIYIYLVRNSVYGLISITPHFFQFTTLLYTFCINK
jgi:hypothetical protein